MSKALVKWEKQLLDEAKAAADQEQYTGGGQFFSIQGGTLSINGAPIPGNEMAVVIVDSVLENVFYEGSFDADNVSSPVCYAFGRDEKQIKPHEEAEKKQSEFCKDCDQNQYGSAEVGRGKACRNRRRLALISAGTLQNGRFEAFEDPEAFENAQVAYLAVPPTSINSFGAYVKQLFGALKRPPYAVFTKIKVVPDKKTQLKLTFDLLDPVPESLIETLIKKSQEAKAAIVFPYPKIEEAPKKQTKKRKF